MRFRRGDGISAVCVRACLGERVLRLIEGEHPVQRLALLDGVDNPSELPGLWQRYVDRSKAATQLDADGDYDGARAAMTAGIDDGSSIAAGFEAFDQAVLARVGSAETQFGFDLINARSPVARIRIAGLVIGVVAAAAAAWGVQRRINDYR